VAYTAALYQLVRLGLNSLDDLAHGLLMLSSCLPHAVLDVIVDDEVELFVRETIVLRQNAVDVVDDGLAQTRTELLNAYASCLLVFDLN
jgi:hypothetical protein